MQAELGHSHKAGDRLASYIYVQQDGSLLVPQQTLEDRQASPCTTVYEPACRISHTEADVVTGTDRS